MLKEIVIESQNKFVLADYSDEPLGDHEIRGKTIATLISQGTELGWADGNDFPIKPGYAAVFQVEEVGKAVSNVKIGETRFCMGHHRATQQHNVHFTLPVPEGLSPYRAVLARLMGVSMTTLMTTKAKAGDRVIVCGAGPVGILAAHNFLAGGFEVTIVEPVSLRRSQAEQSGIKNVLDSMPVENPDYVGKVALVVDCSGHESAVLDGCKIVRKMGEVVLIGVPWRKLTSLTAHDIMHAVFFNFVHLRSGWEWEIPLISKDFKWEELTEGYNNSAHSSFGGFERALTWLSRGDVQTDGLFEIVTPQTPQEVYSQIRSREISAPFIVFDWSAIV